jgi:hypothetical protein
MPLDLITECLWPNGALAVYRRGPRWEAVRIRSPAAGGEWEVVISQPFIAGGVLNDTNVIACRSNKLARTTWEYLCERLLGQGFAACGDCPALRIALKRLDLVRTVCYYPSPAPKPEPKQPSRRLRRRLIV